jgi:Zn finger protein HypA/HybF involved in hydrogenase expression
VAIHLKVGELSDLIEGLDAAYFDTSAREPWRKGHAQNPENNRCVSLLRLRCRIRSGTSGKEAEIRCPDCGADRPALIAGREYFIENMEVI